MSKTATKSVNYSIYSLMMQHKDQMSFETRHGMTQRLTAMAKELQEEGFILRHIKGLKQKHIETLVNHWKLKDLSPATLKNRMSDLRFVCRAQGRANVVKSNDDYGIQHRTYVPTQSKAIFKADFSAISDSHLRLSLELQQAFGLRREECLKLMPHLADKGDYLWLKGSWTKGNIERQIPILTAEQRALLDQAKALVKPEHSLIPQDKNYIQQRHAYHRETRALGLKNLHGLRHAYAQNRYETLTGNKPPILGGKTRAEMNSNERKCDLNARTRISHELGHSRSAITKIYVG